MRVLIVDDDAPFAHMLATQLQKLDSSLDVVDVATADAARQIVQPPNSPFDAFLLDHRLDGSDVDGVTLMSELLASNSNSSAVIFTGYDDSKTKQAASKAGAYWYLSKPFQTWDVIHILRQLHDRNRLKTLNQIAAELQEAVTVQDVADAIVYGALRFGFVRARLRLFARPEQEASDDPEMVGVSQAGSPQIEGFEGLRMPLTRLLYSQQAIAAGRPLFFKGRELGPGGADEFYAAHEAQPPVGEWIKIPILSGRRRIGTLTLDNARLDCAFDPQQRAHLAQVLGLFGKQAAAALERARLHEQTRQQAQEADTLSDIGRRVITAAAKGKLDDLLDEVRRQAVRFIDVTNFMVVLTDLETHALDFRRQYEMDELVSRHWRSPDAGLSGSVIGSNRPFLVVDTKAYCAQHDIAHYGPPAQCWLGVPLRVEDHAVGALVVQSYHDQAAYTNHHQQLLTRVADQVAGAIHMAYRLERQAELEQQDRALSDLRRVMPQLIRESEDNFWHAVLTTITHRDGNSFNRAALFWYDQTGAHMQGRMGIGHFCREEAHKAWKVDRDESRSLQQYFAAPHLARLRSTPLQEEIIGWRMETGTPMGPCYRVWAEGQRLVLSSAELRGSLPAQLLEPPDLPDSARAYECALLPVTSEEGVLGLLVVDNALDGEPLRSGDLDKLVGLLEQAMRIWLQAQEASQIRRLGAEYEQILALSRQITTQAAGRPLKESLEQLCRKAQVLTCADCVVIYPYHPSRGGYDLDAVSHVGLNEPDEFRATTKDKPRQHGVTFTILQSGTLVVPDVTHPGLFFAGHQLAEHTFLRREGIHALIGVPLRHAITGEPLGVIYLDYRTPQKFSEQDIALAEHIAAIGATTISYYREMERETQGRAIAEARECLGRRAIQLISNIQAQALASDSDERKVIRAILQNATELFGRSATIHLALVNWKTKEEEPRQICQDYSLGHLGRLHSQAVNPGKGSISEALNNGRPHISERELAIPIRIGTKPVAVLMIKHPAKRTTFSVVEQEV